MLNSLWGWDKSCSTAAAVCQPLLPPSAEPLCRLPGIELVFQCWKHPFLSYFWIKLHCLLCWMTNPSVFFAFPWLGSAHCCEEVSGPPGSFSKLHSALSCLFAPSVSLSLRAPSSQSFFFFFSVQRMLSSSGRTSSFLAFPPGDCPLIQSTAAQEQVERLPSFLLLTFNFLKFKYFLKYILKHFI